MKKIDILIIILFFILFIYLTTLFWKKTEWENTTCPQCYYKGYMTDFCPHCGYKFE